MNAKEAELLARQGPALASQGVCEQRVQAVDIVHRDGLSMRGLPDLVAASQPEVVQPALRLVVRAGLQVQCDARFPGCFDRGKTWCHPQYLRVAVVPDLRHVTRCRGGAVGLVPGFHQQRPVAGLPEIAFLGVAQGGEGLGRAVAAGHVARLPHVSHLASQQAELAARHHDVQFGGGGPLFETPRVTSYVAT